MSIPVIILAAGASRRLGQPKQLVRVGEETLLGRAIRLAKEADAGPILVVLGADLARIRESISGDQVIVVPNDLWEQGISSSIQAGLQALDVKVPHSAGVMVMTCDQPRLTAEHLRVLRETFDQQKEEVIVTSSYAGIDGVPAVFPRCVFTRLRSLRGDEGARRIIANPPCGVVSIPFAGGELDIDLPEDLARLKRTE
jgi:molybdenum cofactor cytidylyltransferase